MKAGIAIMVAVVGGVAALVFFTAPPQTLENTITRSVLEDDTAAGETQARVISPDEQRAGSLLQADPFFLEVPDFEVALANGNGDTIKLSDLARDKPTLVGFWASWCHNCQRNLPIQDEIFQDYKDQVNVIEVNLAEDRSSVDRYVNNQDFDFLVAYDERGVVSRNWGIQYTNTHALIDTDGSLIEAFSGDVDRSHFEQLLAAASANTDAES